MASETVRDWLQRGGPWQETPRTIETHAAVVFLAGDLAYKMKKPVSLGYLDFTSLEARRNALARELALNARTAADTYLRLVPIVENAGALALGGDGAAVEWLLEMRRFPDGALLAEAADRGALTEAMVEQLAARAARFHDSAERIAGYDWPAAVARIASENTADLRDQHATFAGCDLDRVIAERQAQLASCAAALARQSADIRRCHGDMHLANAFLDHGTPTLFDCIEFDDFYATIPPLYDVAFLLMDLTVRGLPRQANRALNAWIIHRGPEHWPGIAESLATLPLYLALRAEIRAKTEGRRPAGQASAARYLHLAGTLLERQPPRLIAIGGLSGTGKSSLAKNIAWRIGGGVGAVHLRTDEIRKRLAGVALSCPLPPGSYDQETSDRVYAKLIELAQGALTAGATVVLDAVFARKSERAIVSAMARNAGADFTGVWLTAPSDILERRLARRTGDASDADVAVLRRQQSYDLGEIDWHCLDAAQNEADIARDALAAIGEHVPRRNAKEV